MNVIEMKNITMSFGNFKANDNVDFIVKKGEIHALIGENGAGKSTLMSVLFGMYQPTSGSIVINGVERIIKNPIEANKLGIGMVHQHFMLVDTFTLFENIILNSEDTTFGFLTPKEARERIELIMEKYNFKVDLDKVTSKASVAEQQRTEILKMLYKNSDILILDEPTAVLTPQQIDEFLKAILNLQKLGKTIIIISHKLDELKKVASKGTVIRRGKIVGYVDLKKDSKETISSLMVGTSIDIVEKPSSTPMDKIVVYVENLSVNKIGNKVLGLENFSMSIKAGEIVAIAGVEGNGQEEIINALSGLQKAASGKIILNKVTHKYGKKINRKIKMNNFRIEHTKNVKLIEKLKEENLKLGNTVTTEIQKTNIKERYLNGMAFIPQDRHKHGLVLNMKLWENLILQDSDTKQYSKYGILKFNKIKDDTQKVIEQYDVRSSLGRDSVSRSLSGGNQQKFIVGREFSKNSTDFIIVSQPTRGLDVGAINNIHSLIFEAKKQNKAILLISYELDEVLKLADRVIVVNGGKKIKELPIEGLTKETLGKLMTTTDGGQNAIN